MKGITVLKNAVFLIETVSTRLDKQSKNKLFQQTIKDGDFMSTCPIFERQINFKIINCRKTTGKQSIKRQRLWLNNLLIVIQSLHRKVKHPLSFLFSENRENYVISIFNISFLFLKIAIRLASQNLLQDTKFLNRTNFFAFLTSRLWKKIISLQAFYRLMNFGFFSSDVTRISGTVICLVRFSG